MLIQFFSSKRSLVNHDWFFCLQVRVEFWWFLPQIVIRSVEFFLRRNLLSVENKEFFVKSLNKSFHGKRLYHKNCTDIFFVKTSSRGGVNILFFSWKCFSWMTLYLIGILNTSISSNKKFVDQSHVNLFTRKFQLRRHAVKSILEQFSHQCL